MKLLKNAFALALAGCVVFSSAIAAEDIGPITMTVHESNITRMADRDMYGVGAEWVPHGTSHLVDHTRGGVNMEFVNQMKEQEFSMEHFRMAGVSSTGFFWKETLQDTLSRPETNLGVNSNTHQIPTFGVLEHIKLADAFNPGKASIAYTVNLVHEDPQSMADLAEFYYGDGVKNYNGGINWAKKRIEGGHPHAVDVAEWEMGNEIDHGLFSHMHINYKVYVQKVKEIIAAIKSVKEDAPIALNDALMRGWESRFMYAALDELGSEADYVVKHGYITMDRAYLRDATWVQLGEFLDKHFGKGRLKIVVTETTSQGVLSVQEGVDTVGDEGWGACMYFGGARGNADFLLRFLKNPSVAKVNLFAATTGTSYSMYYRDKDQKYKINAAAMANALFQKYGVGPVCESDTTGFETGKASIISSAAIKTDDGINLILVNNTNDTDHYVNFDFENKYVVTEKHYIHAKNNNPFDANYIDREQLERVTETVNDNTVVEGYTVPKATIMALKLKEVQ